jgi:hypothetical protein
MPRPYQIAVAAGAIVLAVPLLVLSGQSSLEAQTDKQDLESTTRGKPSAVELAQAESDELAPDENGGGEDDLLSDEQNLLSEDDLLIDQDELVRDEDELLPDEEPGSGGNGDTEKTEEDTGAYEQHVKLFTSDRYPSSTVCATCHPKQYKEWSVSQHAYAQLSPVYMSMQTTINALTSATDGDFCIRCHNQVGMNLGESVYGTNLDRHATSREGITCVVCHRVDQSYGKASGRLALVKGDLFSPVFGPTGNQELERVLSRPDEYRVVTKRGAAGRGIHTEVKRFFALTKPSFCGMCHDVTLLDGFRLEEAFAEYKRSPAARNGVTCQDCHMGRVQGEDAGYEEGPAAIVGGVPTQPRQLTNHFFAGPDYSIVHPGIFPHNVRSSEFKTLREWLQFDYKAGWGTDEFESNVSDEYEFPEAWLSIDDRFDARDIIEEQLARLAFAKEKRLEVLRNGFAIGRITVDRADPDGIEMKVEVRNATDGHGVPTGFDAERLVYLEVKVTDRDGQLVYVSGDRDPNGDVRDSHSLYVHNGELPLDEDLFSLQTKFVMRLARGGEREQVLPVNQSLSALPFVRPERRATSLYGRPLSARKHKRTIEPRGSRVAQYRINSDKLMGRGPYDVTVKLISQMVPVNLIAAIQGVGFDYGMSPKEIADAIVDGAVVVWARQLRIDTETGTFEESALSSPTVQ